MRRTIDRTRPLEARGVERAPLRAYVRMLAGAASGGELLELRHRLPQGGMASRFFPACSPAGLVEASLRLGQRADVYVGCALRDRPQGGRDAVSGSWVLWVDCDTPESVAALRRFAPAPTMVVRSGARGGRHAYWALDELLAPDDVENANQRLARALGADLACCDPARILRPPATRNFKYEPPAPVTLEVCADGRAYPLAELVEHLPASAPAVRRERPQRRVRLDDPLLAIEPERYIEALLGCSVPRHRKVTCPFHEDEEPSLHVYREAARGWFCFSCRRGGSVYDLAAALWDEPTRGPAFRALRTRLAAVLQVDVDQTLPER
jgi:hypothetical protein